MRYGKNKDGSYSPCRAKPENVGRYGCTHGEHVNLEPAEADRLNERINATRAAVAQNSLRRDPAPNLIEETSSIMQGLVDDYELDYGNGEISFEDYNNTMCFVVEAPNHAAMEMRIPVGATREQVLGEIVHRAEAFDPDEEFDVFWSRSFAEHNGFTPTGFMDMLQEDQQFYRDTARAMRQELDGNKFTGSARQTGDDAEEMESPGVNWPALTVPADADTWDTAEDALEQFGLDGYSSSVEDDGNVLTVTCTAPNGSSRIFDLPKTCTQQDVLEKMAGILEGFDADEEFEEVYSSYDGYEPSTLIHGMIEDEHYFRQTARQLRHEAARLNQQQGSL